MSEHVITKELDGVEVGRLTIRPWELPYGAGPVDRYAEITYLAVDENHQRRGIGTELLHAAYAWARDHGFDHVCVETAAENAGRPGLPFYRQAGFTERLVLLDRPLTRKLDGERRPG